MAIDSVEKRRCVGGNMPTPDGTISIYDRRQIGYNYRGLPIPVALGGTLTPTGTLTRVLSAFRGFGGTLTPTGALARALTLHRELGGTLTPTGDLASLVTFMMALGGTLGLSGVLDAANPAWLLMDRKLIWQGEWDAARSYEIEDVVLYRTSTVTEWHAFVSKIGHNVGNTPTSTAAAWRRLYQEKWL